MQSVRWLDILSNSGKDLDGNRNLCEKYNVQISHLLIVWNV